MRRAPHDDAAGPSAMVGVCGPAALVGNARESRADVGGRCSETAVFLLSPFVLAAVLWFALFQRVVADLHEVESVGDVALV